MYFFTCDLELYYFILRLVNRFSNILLKYFLLSALFFFPFGLVAQSQVYKAGLPNVPGLMERDDQGNPSGFPIEMTTLLAEKAGVQIQWVEGSWSELFNALKKGDIDLLPGTMITPERVEYLDFMDNSLYIQWGEVYTNPENQIESINQLKGKPIALTRDDNNSQGFISYAEQFGINFIQKEYPSFEESLEAVLNGEAIGMTGPSGGLGNSIFSGLENTGIIYNPTTITIAFPKNQNRALRVSLNIEMDKLKQDPSSAYYSLLQKYRVGEHQGTGEFELPAWLQIVIFTIGTSLLLTAILIYLLTKVLKKRNLQLFEQQSQMSQALTLARMGYWEIKYNPETLYWSPELFRIFKCPPITGTFQWEDLSSLLTQESIKSLRLSFQSLMWEWESFDTETQVHTEKGEEFWLEWRGQRAPRTENPSDRFQGICLDITERKKRDQEFQKKEEWLQHSQKMKSIGQLAGGIAHDFNNMLTGIMGYADIVANEVENDVHREYVSEIMHIGERAGLLTRQLLSYARKGEMIKRPFDFHQCVQSVFQILQRTLRSSIQIDMDLQAEDTMITGDFAQMQNVLMNILLNSQDAIPNKGIIYIRSSNRYITRQECSDVPFNLIPGKYICLEIEDDGCGMNQEIQSRAFDPFFTTKVMGKGTGLGLASTYGTTLSHQGAITLDSIPEKGTVITLLFPINE